MNQADDTRGGLVGDGDDGFEGGTDFGVFVGVDFGAKAGHERVHENEAGFDFADDALEFL